MYIYIYIHVYIYIYIHRAEAVWGLGVWVWVVELAVVPCRRPSMCTPELSRLATRACLDFRIKGLRSGVSSCVVSSRIEVYPRIVATSDPNLFGFGGLGSVVSCRRPSMFRGFGFSCVPSSPINVNPRIVATSDPSLFLIFHIWISGFGGFSYIASSPVEKRPKIVASSEQRRLEVWGLCLKS